MTQVSASFPAVQGLFGWREKPEEPSWLLELRKRAAENFEKRGFPGNDDEEWRFTPLGELLKQRFCPSQRKPAESPSVDRLPGSFGGLRVVVGNGHELSVPCVSHDGVRICSLSLALESRADLLSSQLGNIVLPESNPFAALNTARFDDAVVIFVPEGTVVEKPIEIVFWNMGNQGEEVAVSHPRLLVIAEPKSRMCLIEIHGGEAATRYFSNPVTEIHVGKEAKLEHYRVQIESASSYHIGATRARLEKASNYDCFAVTYGGKLSRVDIGISLCEENSSALLRGLYRIQGTQVNDFHTIIEHAAPHCESLEVVKGILEERSHGIFNGRIIVRPGAQKTDSRQTNKNLVLSRDAVVNTNPQLEIYADDVKCTHGATVGHLDETALFYMRSRGIDINTARDLLTYAFANDLLRNVALLPLREWLEREILESKHLNFDRDLVEVS